MNLTESFLTAFDMLDVVFAVCGALIVSLWFGRGKKLSGILLGTVTGGLIKPILTVVALALAVAATTPEFTAQDSKATDDYVKMLGQ
jgi:hypothetical protein